MKFRLEKLNPEYLPIILEWRNTERIRKNMISDRKITLRQHIQWYEKISKSKNDFNFIYLVNEEPIGFIYFNNVNFFHSHCSWGFYIGAQNSFKGSGTVMGVLGLKYIFEELEINKVYGEVLHYNKTSIKFHEKFGFNKEGYFRQHITKNGILVDMIKYGLLKTDWSNISGQLITGLYEKGIYLDEDNNNCCKS